MNGNLVIIGASALGREVYSYACACGMKVKGFLDSRNQMLDGFLGYPKILASVEGYEVEQGDVFVCSIGEPEPRKKYVEMILNKGGRFVSIIHPTALVGQNVQIGVGCIVRPYSVIGNDTIVKDYVIIGTQALLAHDCRAANYVTISPGCHVAGWCDLREQTFLGIHSALCPRVILGESAPVFVAAGAVVTRSCAAGRLMGVPAAVK